MMDLPIHTVHLDIQVMASYSGHSEWKMIYYQLYSLPGELIPYTIGPNIVSIATIT